jgi:hypothetical protein
MDNTRRPAQAETIDGDQVADELRRQIAIEHGEITVAVEGFGTLEPPCARCSGALRSDDTEAPSAKVT